MLVTKWRSLLIASKSIKKMKIKYFVSYLFLIPTFVYSQKLPNPKIGKKETEVSIFILQDDKSNQPYGNGRNALGAHFAYRRTWKKYTKFGAGLLVAADYSSFFKFERDVYPYGAVFADLTQFIGNRQKWSVGGQVGPAIYIREYNYEDMNSKGFTKYGGGMYYSLSTNFRIILSKKLLLALSSSYCIRNFKRRSLYEDYLIGSFHRTQQPEFHDGLGIRIGLVF